MADLKIGTTIGGQTLWTQGNLPLVPSGSKILYKSSRIYTEADKPTANDVGAYAKSETYTKQEVEQLGKLRVLDVRNTNKTPSEYPSQMLSTFFNTSAVAGALPSTAAWYSGINVKGWTDGYASWQIASLSNTGSSNNKLYFRTSQSDTVWNAWGRVYTEFDKPTPADIGALNKGGDTMTGPLVTTAALEIQLNLYPSFKLVSNNLADARTKLIEVSESGHLNIITRNDSGANNGVITIPKSVNGTVYTTGNKPTPADIGALPSNGNAVSASTVGSTNLGRTYSSFFTIPNVAWWGDCGIGHSQMIRSATTDLGAPVASNGYAFKVGARDVGKGHAWFYMDSYETGGNLWYGAALDSSHAPAWAKVYTTRFKPTPADINAVNRDQVNFAQVGTWDGVISKIPIVGSNGCMEIGRYVDFHHNGSTRDYDCRMDVQSDGSMRFANQYGYIDIAPKNGGYCHIYSDKMFYMNNRLQLNGKQVLCLDGSASNSFHDGSGFINQVQARGDSPRFEFHRPGQIAWEFVINNGNNRFEFWQSNGGFGWVRTQSYWDPNGQFWNAGEIYSAGNGNFNDVYIRSDKRLKSNIKLTTNHLDKIMQLKPVVYDKKATLDAETTERELGLIAQDVEEVIPLAVGTGSDEHKIKALKPYALIATLIGAVKEQQKQIEQLKAMIEAR